LSSKKVNIKKKEKAIRKYFLKYQEEWLKDKSRYKIWEKSRRIGATYVQAFEDVLDMASNDNDIPAVWFTSADETAAAEYIRYCKKHAKILDLAAEDLGEVVVENETDMKALVIEFANGKRINALTSSPSKFRSKEGKIIWDEASHNQQDKEMWKALFACLLWGFPLRILSTHNGKKTFFYKRVEGVKSGKYKRWSHHRIDIYTAVEQGLADKICKRELTDEERKEWIQEVKEDNGDEISWQEEFEVLANDEADSYMPYELLASCEADGILWEQNIISSDGFDGSNIKGPKHHSSIWVYDRVREFKQFLQKQKTLGDRYLGYDIGRKKHVSCIWLIEKIGYLQFTRGVYVLKKTPYWVQKLFLYALLDISVMRKACIDNNGIGNNLAEDAMFEYGSTVEPVNMTNAAKAELATDYRNVFEDKSWMMPHDETIRNDHHSIKKFVTAANNVRYDAEANEDGHADRFWAGALANHAAKTSPSSRGKVKTGKKRRTRQKMKDY